MSESNSAEIKPTYTETPIPRVVKVLLTLLLVIIVCFGLSKAVPAIRHALDGNRINSLGAGLVAELDSYGPLEPASGHREEYVNRADMFYPISKWYYEGQAIYPADAGAGNQKNVQEAVDSLISYLEGHGWKRSVRGPMQVGDRERLDLYRGDYSISVSHDLGAGESVEPSIVTFVIASPNTAWF